MNIGLPNSWALTTLGDIVQPTRPRHQPRDYPALPFVGMEHIQAQTMRLLGTVPASAMKSSAVHFMPNDVLYGRLRPYLNKVFRPDFEGLCSAEFIVFPYDPHIEPGYIQYLLNSAAFVSFASHLNAGDRPRVDFEQISSFRVPFPPRREQRRIVEEIEKQFTRLDAAVEALKRVKANLKRYRASVLKAACEGRLVPTEAELARREGRPYEPASELLNRILADRRAHWEADHLAKFRTAGKDPKDDKWKAKNKEPTAPDTANLPELPEGWAWVNLGQLVWSVKDGPHYSPDYATEGVPFITGGQVRPSGVDFDAAKRISPELHAQLCQRCRPERGDILYTKGGTTGIARVNTYDTEFSVWVHVAVLKLAASLEPFYVQHALNSPTCYRQAQQFTHGVGNQDLGLTRMVKITFALPPRSEQKRIIPEVERRLSVIDEIEMQVEANLKRAERLRQAILKHAFEGKLVPQDPDDEPASALLERIKAERAGRAAGSQRSIAAGLSKGRTRRGLQAALSGES